MSSTTAAIVALCLLVCLVDTQRISEQNPDLDRFSAVAQELQEMMRHNKRDFRFHAARGKKYDPLELPR
ncbi:hypothetical protein OESDEN_15208 [Oesophagostomum dentatum]|uniref:Uncharacterized protein n=1 Tax=Oesophagostomum dentatum TaxID=61180 RepID=A0A0B1SMG6_OESDE|nr:hypothetical protein OESDEN_15208 [Oesophagostomum dentatum]